MSLRSELCREVQLQDGGDLKQITRIVEFQSKFTARVISSGSLDTVRWPMFGKFHVKPYRKKKLLEAQE